jgi:hypothetical protein
MTPTVGEVWLARGLWTQEPESLVRIVEVLPSGSVDANYELDPALPADLRILPAQCLIRRADDNTVR